MSLIRSIIIIDKKYLIKSLHLILIYLCSLIEALYVYQFVFIFRTYMYPLVNENILETVVYM